MIQHSAVVIDWFQLSSFRDQKVMKKFLLLLLAISGSRNQGNTIAYPQAGTLIVKRRSRTILQQKCRDISSLEVTEP